MSISHSLAKQKHRLSLLFSLSIFLIILVLDIGLLSFRYFDYSRQELSRLAFQAQSITKIFEENPNIEQDVLDGKGLSLPMGGMRRNSMMNIPGRMGERRNMQTDNFLLRASQDGKLLFSAQKDSEFSSLLFETIQSKENTSDKTFLLNETEYFYLSTPITAKITGIFFTESRMTNRALLVDLLLYIGGAILLSFGVYIISSRFVDTTLAPVEQSMDDMEQFVHNAGHELKTPIAVIQSSLELMRLKKNYDEGIRESMDELKRMNNLIQALISLSTIGQSENFETIDIHEVFEKLEKNYQEKLDLKNISLQIISKKPLSIRKNREYVEILLSNLLSNAIKYNKIGGSIIISIDEKSIEIRDTGIGIAKENKTKIFDRFYQESLVRDGESFGIGLSLVEKIAQMYEWQILVESAKDIGTTITIKL